MRPFLGEHALCARKLEGLETVAASIRKEGGDAFAQACHTGDPEDCERLVAAAVERYGQVDVLVNNAATNPHFGPMLTVEWPVWDKTFEVNVKGYFSLARAVAHHLIERDAKGSIVQVVNVVGTMAAPMQGVYGMTKAAVISMTKTLAAVLGGVGIRVNAIAPGLVETPCIGADLQRRPARDDRRAHRARPGRAARRRRGRRAAAGKRRVFLRHGGRVGRRRRVDHRLM